MVHKIARVGMKISYIPSLVRRWRSETLRGSTAVDGLNHTNWLSGLNRNLKCVIHTPTDKS